jgi:hypothetical protein
VQLQTYPTVVQLIRNGALSASAAVGVDEQGLIQW